MSDDKPPSTTCECGGYIGWTEYPDRWEGSCYGICAAYPVLRKVLYHEAWEQR